MSNLLNTIEEMKEVSNASIENSEKFEDIGDYFNALSGLKISVNLLSRALELSQEQQAQDIEL